MGRPIFISYRRDDSEGEAGRLYDELSRAFGEPCVFMDVVGISPGVDFRNVIEENVSQCGVLLAVIGQSWATISDDNGKRRLENPNDFVRIEIATALARDIALIPVLVHGARMPHPEHLPENLQNLAYRNSVEITHARWSSDVRLLMQALQSYVTAPRPGRNRPIHAEVPVQLPPPYPRGPQAAPPATKFRTPLYAVLGVLLAALIGAGVFYGIHRSHAHRSANTPNPNAPIMETADNKPPGTPNQRPATVASAAPASPSNGVKTGATASSSTPANVAASPASPKPSGDSASSLALGLAGTWVKIPDHVIGITRIVFTPTPEGLRINTSGPCAGCDALPRIVSLNDGAASTSWNLGNANSHWVHHLSATLSGDRLLVTTGNDFDDGRQNQFHLVFVRPGDLPPASSGTSNASSPVGGPVSAANPLVGTWTRPGDQGNAPVKINIYESNGELVAHIWGNCKASPCDWGVQTLAQTGTQANATWRFKPTANNDPLQVSENVFTIDPSGLTVQTQNTFSGDRGRGRWRFHFSRTGQ